VNSETANVSQTVPDGWRIESAVTNLGSGQGFASRRTWRPDLQSATKVEDFPVYLRRNITGESETKDLIPRFVSIIVNAAADESFEDGTNSNFSRTLDILIRSYGSTVIVALETIVCSEKSNAEVVGEALRWIGAARDEDTKAYRRAVLQKHLRSLSPRIRYAAALGLAEMDDPGAIPALRNALEREIHEKIRCHFLLVLEQLVQTQKCHNS
jgi:hypothetical protein